MVALVAQFVPSAHVPPVVQLAEPETKEEVQPAGRLGGVTSSKLSVKEITAQGMGVGVAAGVAGGEAVAEGVGVGGTVGVGEGVGE